MSEERPEKRVSFTIRKVAEDELDQVIEINEHSLPEHYWYGFYKYILDEWGDVFLVAEVNNKIVGYIMNRIEETSDKVLMGLENELENQTKPHEGGPLDRLRRIFDVERATVGHVVSIAVLEGYRRMGIGSALLREAIGLMLNHYDVNSIYLEVRVSNNPAIRLYEKFGFVKARIIRGYYRDGEDAYVMVKRIKPITSGGQA